MYLYSFKAVWCRPCASLKLKLAKEALKYHMDIIEIDIDLNSSKLLVEQYRIHSVPTVILVDIEADSEVEVDRFAGDISRKQLDNFFQENTSSMQGMEHTITLLEVNE